MCGDKPHARFGEGGTGDPVMGDRPLLYSFSSEVALDSTSRHVCWFDAEAYLRLLQARDHVIKEGCKETETSTLVISSEG